MAASSAQSPVLHSQDRRQLDELLRLQRKVLASIALGERFEAILNDLCLLIERMVPGSVATLMAVDDGAQVLKIQAAPSLPAAVLEKLNGLAPGMGAGSCGTAVWCGRPVYVSDTMVDPRWFELRHLAQELGIRSCWSIPILSDTQTVLGTFAISSPEARSPRRFHVRLLETASYLAGIAIQRTQQENALRSTADQLRNVTDAVPGALFQYQLGDEGIPRLTFISRGAEKLWGVSIDSLREDFRLAWDRILPEDQASVQASILASAHDMRPWNHEFRLKRPDGSLRWLHVSAVAVADASRADGSVVWNSIVFDITERKRTEEQLTQWATAFENTSEGVLITDVEGRILNVNRAFCDITGYELDEVRGHTPRLLGSGRHGKAFFQSMWASLKTAGKWQGEIWNRRKNGEVYPEWLSISQVTDARGAVVNYVGVFADISSIKETELRLLHLAHHDPLTNLPNRLLCTARLEHALDQAARHPRTLALLFLDLDRFKNVNDSLGHALGDELLVQAARRLQRCVRQEDTVARLGGDEFIVILENLLAPADAGQVAEKILTTLERPFSLQGHDVVVTGSVGISLYPQDGTDCETLLKNADAAMYRAKELGRNNYACYTPELGFIVEERFSLESSLRGALEREEFDLFFQPQVSAGDGRLVGAEVLLRWRHPELGLVGPNRFIPIAEETGLIGGIGEWVLRKACLQALSWQRSGLPAVRLAVNLSGQQITPERISRHLEEILGETGLAPGFLELEITESFVMRHPEKSVEVLDTLKRLGISLAIDDFGTGYSSLGYLKRLPVHKLKIDQSLVRDIASDPNDEAIAKAVIALGHSLGLSVIAEGVGTEQQCDFLRREGCDELQGYLYGRPCPAEQFAEMLGTFLP